MIKKLLKKTAIHKVYRTIRNRMDARKIRNINKRYSKEINVLHNPDVLERKINELNHKSADNTPCYVIAQSNTTVGLYGYINCFLPHIAVAVAKGYIPVIDMQTYDNIYIPKSEKGKKAFNAWDSFFEQPMNIGMNDLSGKKIKKCPEYLWYTKMPSSNPMMSDQELRLWSSIAEKYIRFNNVTQKYCDQELAEILKYPNKTIGVIYRGTTYTKGQAKGHPIQPSKKMLKEKIQEMMQNYQLEYIYIASDEKSIVNYLNQEFPGRVLINKRVYYDEVDQDYSRYNLDGTDIVGDLFNRDNNEYLIGLEYISSMNIVAHCGYFVGGACGGTTAVLWMNGMKYIDKYVFDLGKYGFAPVPEDEE